jgi:hypothetical protein
VPETVVSSYEFVVTSRTLQDYSPPARIPNTDSLRPLAPWIPLLSETKSPVIYNFYYWLICYLYSSVWLCVRNECPLRLVTKSVPGRGRQDRWTLLRASEGVVASLALLDELLLHPSVECQIFGSEYLDFVLAVTADKGHSFLLPGTAIRSVTSSLQNPDVATYSLFSLLKIPSLTFLHN